MKQQRKCSFLRNLMLISVVVVYACASTNLDLQRCPVGSLKLKDGRYIGQANLDWRNSAEVEITIENRMITHIRVIRHRHGPKKKYNADEIISRIIKAQSTSVDAVTGATVTSKVITGAVQDAINRAVVLQTE